MGSFLPFLKLFSFPASISASEQMDGKGEGSAIGIDLDTAYSCVGAWQHDRVEIIANDRGNRTTPSYVVFTDTELLVGDAAKNKVAMNPLNTVFDAERLIGRRFSGPSVQSDIKLWPFKVIAGPGNKPQYNGDEKQLAAEEITSMVLNQMREIVKAYLGSGVKNAVVTGERKHKKDIGGNPSAFVRLIRGVILSILANTKYYLLWAHQILPAGKANMVLPTWGNSFSA